MVSRGPLFWCGHVRSRTLALRDRDRVIACATPLKARHGIILRVHGQDHMTYKIDNASHIAHAPGPKRATRINQDLMLREIRYVVLIRRRVDLASICVDVEQSCTPKLSQSRSISNDAWSTHARF